MSPVQRSLEDIHGTRRTVFRAVGRRTAEKLATLAEEEPRRSRWKRLRDYTRVRLWEWIRTYFAYRGGAKPNLPPWPEGETGIFPLEPSVDGPADTDDDIRVSLFSDWASATDESVSVAEQIDRFEPHFTIHLGDIYYVGSRDAAMENYPHWPRGSVGSFALNGNHEMYANGEGYFGYLLPRIGLAAGTDRHIPQRTSFFALENRHWRIIGLDTGYHSTGLPVVEKIFKPSCRLPDPLMAWLETRIFDDNADGRAVILLSHHQYVSAFEREHTRAGKQLHDVISGPVLWFWGHEHRLAGYGANAAKDGVTAYGRCIGHGGMPVEKLNEAPKAGRKLAFFDNRRYKTLEEKTLGLFRRETPIGYNGFANLLFQGPELKIEYRDFKGELILWETWRTDPVAGALEGTGAWLHPLSDPGEGRYRRIVPDLRMLQR